MPNSLASPDFLLAGGRSFTQLLGALGGEGGVPAGVHAALPGRGDALALTLEDQEAFGLGERAHDPQQ